MSRVLLVDDNVDAVHSTAQLLKLWGHEVQLAPDASSAISAARVWRPHLVLLDIGLPGMDGFQAAVALRQETMLGCRIIAMSALYLEHDDARLAAAGIDQFLRKPLEVPFLRSLLGSPAMVERRARLPSAR